MFVTIYLKLMSYQKGLMILLIKIFYKHGTEMKSLKLKKIQRIYGYASQGKILIVVTV
jgi:hypothetical protein